MMTTKHSVSRGRTFKNFAKLCKSFVSCINDNIFRCICMTHHKPWFLRLTLATLFQSQSLQLNPLYLMISATVAASLAFCLPSATAPNALVFSFKEIRVIDMVSFMICMN